MSETTITRAHLSEAVYQEVISTPPELSSPEAPETLANLPGIQDQVVDAALDNNPDVIRARFDESAADHQITVLRGQLLPAALRAGRP